jgi:hypothetical protein
LYGAGELTLQVTGIEPSSDNRNYHYRSKLIAKLCEQDTTETRRDDTLADAIGIQFGFIVNLESHQARHVFNRPLGERRLAQRNRPD